MHCCHAIQNKVWATAPDALWWKWYRITDDTDVLFPAPEVRKDQRRQADCCSDQALSGSPEPPVSSGSGWRGASSWSRKR